jgi:hypothetical protein
METLKFRQALFWDVDPKKIDVEKNAQYVIERIFDFGNDKEVKWLWNFYDKALLREVLEKSKCLSPKTRALWTLLLKNE